MIHVIGIGAGGRKSLGDSALSIIEKAGLIVGGKRHLAEFPESRARKVAVTGSLDEIARSIREEIKNERRAVVAVLATGDPLLYGIAGYIIRKFGKKRVEVIPNVSTVQEAFAMIKESSNGVKVVSAHGRQADYSALASVLRDNDRVAIFTDPVNTPAKIAKEMLGRGVGERRAFVCESIGTPNERVVEGTMKTLSAKKSFAPLNVLIFINEGTVSGVARSVPGYSDKLFSHSPWMITKEELRVVSLSKLDIDRKSMVWDIGACSGSVAIEAALCAPLGTTWAIEKDKKRLSDIRKNKLRFNVPNLEIIAGEAPACIPSDLPAPDAVKSIADVAFLEQDLALAELDGVAKSSDSLQRIGAKVGEQRVKSKHHREFGLLAGGNIGLGHGWSPFAFLCCRVCHKSHNFATRKGSFSSTGGAESLICTPGF